MSLAYKSVGTDGSQWPSWVRDLKSASGVYVIKAHGDDGRVLYVGSSAGKLYDTITRHFQQWKRRKNWWKGMRGAHHDPGIICAILWPVLMMLGIYGMIEGRTKD